jgi:hypothetical protein
MNIASYNTTDRQTNRKILVTSFCSIILYVCLVVISLLFSLLIAKNLWNITIYINGEYIYAQCLLQPNYTSGLYMCYFSYILGSFTIFGALIVSIVSCISTRLVFSIANVMFSIFALMWWSVSMSIISGSIEEANNIHTPHEYWRNIILGLGWTQVGISLLLIISSTIFMIEERKISRIEYIHNLNRRIQEMNQQIVIFPEE